MHLLELNLLAALVVFELNVAAMRRLDGKIAVSHDDRRGQAVWVQHGTKGTVDRGEQRNR